MTWRYPTLTFRCGACGTQATGFVVSGAVERFAKQHAEVCPGYPPSGEASAALPDTQQEPTR